MGEASPPLIPLILTNLRRKFRTDPAVQYGPAGALVVPLNEGCFGILPRGDFTK